MRRAANSWTIFRRRVRKISKTNKLKYSFRRKGWDECGVFGIKNSLHFVLFLVLLSQKMNKNYHKHETICGNIAFGIFFALLTGGNIQTSSNCSNFVYLSFYTIYYPLISTLSSKNLFYLYDFYTFTHSYSNYKDI